MAKVSQSKTELQQHLKEQFSFLSASSAAYDAGHESEAKRLAQSLRVLLHDTANSKALLWQLHHKQLKFLSSSFPLTPGNIASHSGLIAVKFQMTERDAEAQYIPHLGDVSRQHHKWKNFYEWWIDIVISVPRDSSYSRKDLILLVSNKDGGAHVDPKLDEQYYRLSRQNSLGWKLLSEGEVSDISTRPELASVRQIAFEVTETLKKHFVGMLT